MKALVCEGYGSVDRCDVRDVPVPDLADNSLLIRVEAASLNRSDWEGVVGKPAYSRSGPGGLRGKLRILGTDVAGVVEEIGKGVTRFHVGDEVFGDLMYHGGSTFAEYVVAPESTPLAHKPPGITYEQAACLPQSGMIAVQALRASGGLQSGETLLVNGGGGGTGLMLIQMATRRGAKVTGVDNDSKWDAMKRAGADDVLDYRREDYSRRAERYDRIVDLVGSRSIFANARALSRTGVYLLVGGPVARLLSVVTLGRILYLRGRRLRLLIVRPNVDDLELLAGEVDAGRLDPTIESTYSIETAADAVQRLGGNEAVGKLVVTPGK